MSAEAESSKPALADRRCVAMKPGSPALSGAALDLLLAQLAGGWRVCSGPRLRRRFQSTDYAALAALAARIAQLAGEQDHHPEIALAWGRLEVSVWTHSVGGLSENDLVLAAGIDRIAAGSGF